MKTYIRIIGITIVSLFLTVSCSTRAVPEGQDVIIGMGNPAAVYCEELGYNFNITTGDLGEQGVCEFTPGQQCDAWDFLNGICGEEYSYCAQQGYSTVLKENDSGSSLPTPVCVDDEGKEIGTVVELTDLFQKSLGCGVNQMTPAKPPDQSAQIPPPSLDQIPPPSFDWRNYDGGDWTTPVKNQGGCGSCWAFAAVGITESAINISRDDPGLDLNLSEQYLVTDCQPDPYAGGYQNCCGGYKDWALDYIYMEGIPDEGCLSYVDGSSCTCDPSPPAGTPAPECYSNCTNRTGGECSDRTCGDRCGDWASRLVYISNYGWVGSSDPAVIKDYLLQYGPLAVSMRVESTSWNLGDPPYSCSGSLQNHGVIVVGYDDAGGYWIVRNSWGSGFGDGGYFHVGFGECGIEEWVYGAYNNDPPNIPQDPAPGDTETGVSLSSELTWTGGDLNPGDILTYDVYFDAGNPDPSTLICDDAAAESCNPGVLIESTLYYWKVISHDNAGNETIGPIWEFTTESGDFDNIGFYVPSKYRWYFKTDRVDGWSGVISMGWGGASELQPVIGDWDGDGVDTAGFYKPSQYKWLLKDNQISGWSGVTNFNWGGAVVMTPIAGDWDGDGDDTVGFYNEATGEWYLKDENTAGWSGFTKVIWGGAAGNIPIVGDWNGDGSDTIGYFVPSQNKWWLKSNLVDGWSGVSGFSFGTTDPMEPVTGDWDGDGTDTVGGYTAARWRWYLKDDQVSGWSNVSVLRFGPTAPYEVLAGDWQ